MKSRIGIITNDGIFFGKIRLLLRDEAEVVRIEGELLSHLGFDTVFVDTRDAEIPKYKCVTFGEGCDVSIPFRHEDVISAFKRAIDSGDGSLTLSDDARHAYLFGGEISLTKLEFKLLEKLMSIPVGTYISRDELLEAVWGGECDPGVVVVYMHYLRKKLETDGTKIILTKRTRGDSSYKIDERYRRDR